MAVKQPKMTPYILFNYKDSTMGSHFELFPFL